MQFLVGPKVREQRSGAAGPNDLQAGHGFRGAQTEGEASFVAGQVTIAGDKLGDLALAARGDAHRGPYGVASRSGGREFHRQEVPWAGRGVGDQRCRQLQPEC